MTTYLVTIYSHDAEDDFTDEVTVEARSEAHARGLAWREVQDRRGLYAVTFDAAEVEPMA